MAFFLGENYSIVFFAILFPSNISKVVRETALISYLIRGRFMVGLTVCAVNSVG